MIGLIVLQFLLFIGLVVLLRRLMGRHATTATAHLQGLSQEYLRKQDEVKQRLEESERQYQEHLTKAQEEAHRLKQQALTEADLARQQALDQAHEEAERIVQQANQAREALQNEMVHALDAKILERACQLLQQVLPDTLGSALQSRWLDELTSNGMMPVEQLQSREAVREARVVSAYPLTDAQRRQLKDKLRAALGTDITMHESVDPRIVAGLVITIGHLVLDGSLASKLQEAARHVQDTAG